MALKFNPLTGNFDFTGSGGGGASYIDGEVSVYTDLSLDAGVAPLNSAWLVRTASGVWPVSRKQAGIYIRTATGGSSRDADYTYAGTMPDVFSDAQFTVYDDADTSKNLQFQLSGLTTATTRTLTAPNASGRIQIEGQAIGDTTPAAGSFTSLTSRNLTGDPELLTLFSQFGDTKFYGTHFTIPNINLLDSTDLYLVRGGGKVAVGPYTAAPTARLQVNGNVAANNGTLTASAPVLDLSQTWNNAAVAFTGLRFNATDTTSATASLLADLQVGGSSRVSVNKNGTILASGVSSYVALACAPNFISMDIAAGTTLAGSGTETRLRLSGGGASGVIQFFARNGTEFRIDDNAGSGTTGARLIADATDTLAQRRTTNAQTFRLYNTTDAGLANYERGFMRWSSNVLQIGTEKLGTGSARALQLQTDGTTRFTFSSGGSVFIGDGSAQANNFFGWSGNGGFRAQQTSAGVITLFNWAETDFNRLQFGGTTSSFPALKRSTTSLQVRLADDSAFAPFVSGDLGIGVTPERPLHIQGSAAFGRMDRQGVNGPAWLMIRMATGTTVTSSWLFGPANGVAGVVNDDFSIIDYGSATSGTSGTQRLTIAKSDGQLTVNGNLNLSTKNLVTDTTTGTKIGTGTTQLLGFWNATPAVQPAAVADATDAATVITQLNALLSRLRTIGVIAT